MTRKLSILGLLAYALIGAPAVGFAAGTTVSLSANPASTAPLGTPVTLTATLSPSSSTGTVTFYSGFTNLGGATVSSGTASLSVLLPLGSQTLKAVLVAGSGLTPVSTSTVAYNVTPAAGSGFGLVPGTGSGTGANGSTVQADFNNDGKMDIAYVNGAGQIIVALGRENGTFAAEAGKPVLAAGTTPTYLAVGDFNNDGNVDLAYTSGGSTGNEIVVYLGNGDGTFGPSGNGQSAAVIAVNTQSQNWSSEAFSGYNGTYNPLVSLAVGDFNGDGIPDLITTTAVTAYDYDYIISDIWSMPQVIVLLGNGAGNFPTQKTSQLDGFTFTGGFSGVGTSVASPYGIAIGNFTNNGKASVVISAAIQAIGYVDSQLAYEGAGAAVRGLYLFTGNGDGTFTAPGATLPSPGGPTNFVAGDFNGDGYLDLAVNDNAGNVQVLLNGAPTSAGTFTLVSTPSYIRAGGFGAMATGDFNGDGKLDLVMSAGTGVVSVLGAGNGTFGGPSPAVAAVCGSGGTPGGILTGDYGSPSTSDNARDSFLVACTGSEAYAVGLGRAPTTTVLTATDTTTPATIGETATLSAAVTPGTATGKVTFYSGTKILGTSSLSGGTAKLTNALMPPSTASAGLALVARYEGDVSNGVSTGSASLPVKAVAATGFTAAQSTQANAQVIVQADFNQDGIPDLAVSDGGNRITVLLGKGDGTYTAQPEFNGIVNARGLAAVDVNGDGFPDLILLDSAQFGVYLGNGSGGFTVQGSSYQFQGQINSNNPDVKVADFNLDGIPDLAVATDNGSGYVTAFLGNGDGTFQAGVTSEIANNSSVNQLGRTPQAVAAGDFNNDGIPDLLVLAQTASGYDLFNMVGQGDGTFAMASVSPLLAPGPPAGNSPYLTTGDFNGDGYQDVAYLDTSNNLWVGLGSASGVFSYATTSFGLQTKGFVTADFNGDGKLDLATIIGGSEVAVLYGVGQGTFAAARKFSVCNSPQWIVATDYNGDGRSDFALACGNSSAQAYLGQGLSLGPLNPASTVAGAGVNAPFTLTISALNSNFAAGDVVNWLPTGSTTATTLVPSTIGSASLKVTISGAPNDVLLASQGTASISVTDPSAGVTSNAQTFTVGPPPVISGVVPATAAVGGTSDPITISGTNLASGDTITFQPPNSGTPITGIATTFSNGVLTATLPQGALATVGAGSIFVVDGSSGVSSVAGFPFNVVAAPALSTLNPTTVAAGSQSLSLTINGSGFVTGDTVNWTPSGAALQAISGSAVQAGSNQITVTVPSNLLAATGTASIAVVDPDGAASNALTITLAAPTVTTLSPASAGTLSAAAIAAGSGGFTLAVNGSNFVPGSMVSGGYNGSVVLFTDATGAQHTLTPTNSTTTQLQVAVPGAYIGGVISNLAQVQVQNPGAGAAFSGGAVSNAVTLPIGAPAITSVNPAAETSVPANSPSPSLTVNGANFASTSVLVWCNLCSGSPTVITPSSPPTSTQLTVSIPTNNPNLLAATGTTQIYVANDPANLTGVNTNSTAVSLPIASLAITAISPTTVLAGGPAFTLTISGQNQNFNGLATVDFGNGLPPIQPASTGGSVTGNSITLTVPASYITTPGTLSVQVVNPGGATSPVTAASTLTIQQLSISNVVPSPLVAGSPAMSLEIQGQSFTPATTIVWTSGVTSTTLPTPTFNSAGDLDVVVSQALLAQAATVQITAVTDVQNVPVSSPAFTLAINGPVIGTLSPTSSVVNGGAFPLVVNGSNFLSGSTVHWTDGTGTTTSLTTSFTSATQLIALVPTSLLTTAGTALVTVVNPAPAGSTGASSSGALFSIGPTPTINTNNGLSVCPGGVNCSPSSSATAGSATFLLEVNGTNYQPASIVVWTANGVATNLVTQFTNAEGLQATVPASLLTNVTSALITVENPGNAISNGVIFSVNAGATPTVTSLLPANGVTVGSAAFELTVIGTSFVNGAQVNWTNAGTTTGLTTVLQNSQTLYAVVPANLVATVGTAFITVVSAGATSNSTPFNINALPAITITSVGPQTATAGGTAFSLTIDGSNFTANSEAQWIGGAGPQTLATTLLSPQQLSAVVPASYIATAETAFISVVTGSVTSNALAFSVNGDTPSITSLSSTSAVIGAAGFPLAVTGASFVNGAVATWTAGSTPTILTTVFVSPTQLTLLIPAGLLTTAGTVEITVQNPDKTVSNGVTFQVVSGQAPTLTAVNAIGSVLIGNAIELAVTGANFANGSVVLWTNGAVTTALATTFTDSGDLTAVAPAGLVTAPGTVSISVVSAGVTSTPLPFTIPAITITSLSPTTAVVGGPTFPLTVNGQNFTATSAVQWIGASGTQTLTTTVINSTQLSVLVPATLIAAPATVYVNVATGTLTSNSLPLTVSIANAPTIASLGSTSIQAGSAGTQISVIGTNFVNGSMVQWNAGGTPQTLATAYGSSTLLTAIVPANLIATAGTVFIGVQNPNNGGTSNLVEFTINAVAGPSIATTGGILPASAPIGSAGITISITGANFENGAVVDWNTSGTPTALTTGFVSATQLTALVPASLFTLPATALITVQNPDKSLSNAVPFLVISGQTPVLTAVNAVGNVLIGSAIQLAVTGANFANGAVVEWTNGTTTTALATTFTDAGDLTALAPASLVTAPGTVSISVLSAGVTSTSLPFTIPTISITSLTPTTAVVGGPTFPLTVSGQNFTSNSAVQWTGASGAQTLATTLINSTQLSVLVPAALIASPATVYIDVVTGALTSNSLPLTISVANAPTVTSLSTTSIQAGSAGTQISVMGTNFVNGSVVQWNAGGTPQTLGTAYGSSTLLTAIVPANLIATAGTVFIGVQNPNNGGTSNLVQFTINAVAGPTIATTGGITPVSALIGSAGISLSITGTNFANGAVVQWNTTGTPTSLTTGFISATQLTALLPASLLTAPVTAFITVQNPNLSVSNGVTFQVTSGQTPVLTSVTAVGSVLIGNSVQLAVVGANFASGAVVQWTNGTTTTALTTTFTSSGSLTAVAPASLVTAPGTVSISVLSAGATSAALPFTIPTITLTSLTPATVVGGGPTFPLTVTGQNFTSNSVVQWTGGSGAQTLATTLITSTQLSVLVPGTLIATPATVFVSVATGTLISNSLPLTITAAAAPSITSLGTNSIQAGAGATEITVIGTNFANGSVVQWNAGGTPQSLATAFGSSTLLTALVPATLIATPATVFISVANPNNGGTSNLVDFTILPVAGPTIASSGGLLPSSAATGTPGITLTISGANFVNGAVVQWNTTGTPTALTTGFVSSTQLTALLPASLLLYPATALVSVQNPNMLVSNAAQFLVTGSAPVTTPTLTAISPVSASAGAPTLQLSLTGLNFSSSSGTVSGSVVQWNGSPIPTAFVSATQLTATVDTSLLQAVGANFVSVMNGTSSSGGMKFQVNGPTLTAVAPATVTAGSAAFNIVLTGTNFVAGSTVVWNGALLPTTLNSATQVTAQVPASQVATAGSAYLLVTNPGGASTGPLTFTISTPPASVVTSLSPASAVAGSSAFQLFVTGSGFVSGSTVFWNGSPLPTGFVSATQVTALVGSNLIALPGSANVAVQNPGAAVSATVAFAVTGPSITTLTPATANAGDPGFTLTVVGTNFVPGTAIQWNGAMLPTSYTSATQVQAAVSAALVASPATISVTAQNPGGATSASQSFIVGQPSLSITTASLPNGVVGTLYSQTLVAQGGNQPYTWTITAGTLPGGVNLNASSGTMSGTPTGAANVVLSVTVTDSMGRTAVKSLSLQVYLALTITTPASLPVATAGTSYSEVLAATGGSPPYLWSVAGNLPPGLSLNVATGQISGLPVAPGGYNFTVNITDSQGQQNASQAFTATVTVASLTIGGLAASTGPAQQIPVTVSVGSAYTVALSGTLTLSFTSLVGGNDPSIQFSTGGTTVAYTIPAGSTTAVFPQNTQLLLTTGTVAGTITIKSTLQAGSTDITPSPAPQATTAIPEEAPVITSVSLQPTTGGVTVTVAGYATSKQVTQASLQFNPASGSSLTASTITVPLTAIITAWYQSAASASFGSQFTVSIPVNVAGNVSAIGSVTVTLTNAQGNSATATATLQ